MNAAEASPVSLGKETQKTDSRESAAPRVVLTALGGLPEIRPGDDIAGLVTDALSAAGISLQAGDMLVLASKIISKVEGRQVNLASVSPSERAKEVAVRTGKDPHLVELILRESAGISRMTPGLLIVRHRLGFTSANAGIDRSNVVQEGAGETVLLLPESPDDSAARLRAAIHERSGISLGIVIADSHGRPFRLGTVGVAIGVAGLPALWDRRGELDRHGYPLQHTEVGTADEIAAAAGLLMGQTDESTPAVHIRGLSLPPIDGQAADLNRPPETDVYL
ncbi:MAG: coenzyme F420-0:L-glutamate ligase [Chloroflexota bacterium]|nr:MAG: coenzyme F420-0:L-glutamate ligase [Chloroflexota bacterium]